MLIYPGLNLPDGWEESGMPNEAIDEPRLAEALAYWDRKRGDRVMPRRADIDPTEITALLPNLRLTEVLDGGTRYRYRLVGTAIVAAYGVESTGRYLDELCGERRDFVEGLYRAVCDRRRPLYAKTAYLGPWQAPNIASRVMAPLSEDGETVNMVLAVLTFDGQQPRRPPIGLDSAMDLARSSVRLL